MQVRLSTVCADLQPVWSDAEGCWCTRDLWVFRFDYRTGQFRKVFRLPRKANGLLARVKDALARSALRRRLRPGADVDNLVQLANGEVVVIFDQVYRYVPGRPGEYNAEVLPTTAKPPMAAPLRGGVAVHGPSQRVYFGEYLNGHQRDIRVFRVDTTARSVDACWSFPRSDIKHIHAVLYDRFRNRLWICTGDQDHESAFYYTDDEFQTVHRFAGGDQSWRAIAVLFDETGMEWGMDAGKDAPAHAVNRIYRYHFATGERTERAVIGNPAYAACTLSDGTALMQTSFEPGRLQDTPEAVALWLRGHDRTWRPCFELPYRLRPRTGAGRYGHLLLPGGVSPAGQVLCAPVNTTSHAYHLLRLCWDEPR